MEESKEMQMFLDNESDRLSVAEFINDIYKPKFAGKSTVKITEEEREFILK